MVEKLKHTYVRLAPLQSQLLADVPSNGQDRDPSQHQSALKHFIGCTTQGQQYLDRLGRQPPLANGKHKNGLQPPPAPASSLFLGQLQQEVERLRRFVQSCAEKLWMRLLAAADGLSELRQRAAKLQSQAQQQDCLLHHQELCLLCDRIGEQQAPTAPKAAAAVLLKIWCYLPSCLQPCDCTRSIACIYLASAIACCTSSTLNCAISAGGLSVQSSDLESAEQLRNFAPAAVRHDSRTDGQHTSALLQVRTWCL